MRKIHIATLRLSSVILATIWSHVVKSSLLLFAVFLAGSVLAMPLRAAFADSARSQNSSKGNFDEENYLGLWKYYDEDHNVVILKISKVRFGDYRFSHNAYKFRGQIFWPEPQIENADGMHLKPLRGKLIGHFVSYNFWATHSQVHNVDITIESKPNGKLNYCESGVICLGAARGKCKSGPTRDKRWSRIGQKIYITEKHEATKISSNVNEDSHDIPEH